MIYMPTKTDFNKLAIFPLQNAESWQCKTRWLDLHFCLFVPIFSSPFHHECDTCDSKKTTSLLEGARYAYARGILFLSFWLLGLLPFSNIHPAFFQAASLSPPFRFFVYFYLKHAETNVYVNSILHFWAFRKKFVTFSCFFPSLRRYLPIYL